MGTNAPTADNVADILQNLEVNAQIQPTPTLGAQEAGVDPTRAGVADASTLHTGYFGMDAGIYYALPPSHGFYLGGYDYPGNDWEDYSRTTGSESTEGQTGGAYNENTPLVYHPSGLAYNPQHVYTSYTAGASMRADGHMFGPHGYPYATPLYQSLPSSSPFGPSSGPSSFETSTVSTRESSSDRTASNLGSGNNGPSGTRAGHMGYPSGLYNRGVLPVSAPSPGSQDVRVGYEGTRLGNTWSDSSKAAENQQRHSLSSLSSSGPNARPLAPLLPHFPASQQHRPRVGGPASAGAFGRGFQSSTRIYPGFTNSGRFGLSSVWEPRGSGRQWYPFEREKSWGRGLGTFSNGSQSWDILNEQNRGPRTTRGRYQRPPTSVVRYVRTDGAANTMLEPSLDREQYNRTDFKTSYENAKYFIIKSYSEDDIHKSIKYSVWASTVNGNRKLDAAYREAQSHTSPCPLFLFFSVNASGQFCGVAEMVGLVDFNKNLEFWQQDKWTGRIPVKWHIVKDVPNSQFRHIILENNDNKPVTNSRDTQEVSQSQGSEMLTIFKNYSLKTSILDDFQFYETRQKFMQDSRARKQTHLQHQPVMHRGNGEQEQRLLSGIASSSSPQDAVLNRTSETLDQSKAAQKSSDVQESIIVQDVQNESIAGPPQSQETSQADSASSRPKSMEKSVEK